MSYQIRVRLDATDAPTDAEDRYEAWKQEFRPILEDQEVPYQVEPERFDGERPAYAEFQTHFDVRDDLDEILRSLTEDHFPDVEWFVVHTRRNDTEMNLSVYRDDPDYYDPSLTEGLRTPLDMNREDRFSVEYGDIHYLLDGEELMVPEGSIQVERPENDRETVGLYVDANEDIGFSGDLRIATIEVHPGKIVDISVENIERVTEGWGDPYLVRGDAPEPFIDDSERFPEPRPRELRRDLISADSHEKIAEEIREIDSKSTREALSGIFEILTGEEV